jgi:hypothetical protein
MRRVCVRWSVRAHGIRRAAYEAVACASDVRRKSDAGGHAGVQRCAFEREEGRPCQCRVHWHGAESVREIPKG